MNVPPVPVYLPSLLCSDFDGCWWLGFSAELLCAGGRGGGAGRD
jgi:hypothetical protein